MERFKESQNRAYARTQSIASSSSLVEDSSLDNVDQTKLYESVLKLIILEYRNEARFRTPIKIKPSMSNGDNRHHSSGSNSLESTSGDLKLPSNLLDSLEKRLNVIAMKKEGKDIDEMTRRSLLRLYTEILDPNFKVEARRINKPEYLVMKFVTCSNKEMVKMGIPSNEVPSIVFKQTGIFVQILINLVRKEKNSEAIIAKLNEYKESVKPTNNNLTPTKSSTNSASSSSLSTLTTNEVKYPQPSFRLSDMEQTMINLVSDMFGVDSIRLQQDIIKYKDFAHESTLQKDINQVQFYLSKDLGQFAESSFLDKEYYQLWKSREDAFCTNLLTRYQPLTQLKNLPALPSGSDFYILPPTMHTRAYFVVLLKKCFDYEKLQEKIDEERIFSKPVLNLVSMCSKFWRIDFPTRVTSLYTAAHLVGYVKDDYYMEQSAKELGAINVQRTCNIFHYSKRILSELGKLDWEDKIVWSLKDQDMWAKNLTQTYNEVFQSIKDSLSNIFNKTSKPQFAPYLQFLGEYLESDSLFHKVEETGIVKKWEKKLTKTLLRTSEMRYAELLSDLPRDDTLSVIHILNISDGIVDDIKMLQKRYKAPLLGFLNVSRTSAAVITGMFASDAKNIMKHIQLYAQQKDLKLPYGDAIEAYKSLSEIRSIYDQVSLSSTTKFSFDLEQFFYPYLGSWVEESGEKIKQIIDEAINRDKFEAIDLNNDSKKFSTSVLDIFTLVKEYLRILKNLNWKNIYQISHVYTVLLKSISDGVLKYCSRITDKILAELNEDEIKKTVNNEEIDKRKSGNGWFDEVKNVVSNIQGNKLESEEPYNFKPETCVALNNLSAMMNQLTKLEEFLDPEAISNAVSLHDPSASKNYTSHVFSVRIVSAENIKSSSSTSSHINSYITMIDTQIKKTIGKTRIVSNTDCPEWDEEFEFTIPANSLKTISITVWDAKFGTHAICGRALLQLEPRHFKHDGLPQQIILDLDLQGRVLLEVAVESERLDAIFVMGRAHRALKRSQERCIKLIVQKFSRFIHLCFSRANLKSICGSNGNIKPTQDQIHNAMTPLYDYLNSNLRILAQYLSNELLMNVMLAAWLVVISSADEILLPKLASVKSSQSNFGSTLSPANGKNSGGWQSAVTSAMANVSNTIGIGFGKQLTNSELETVFSWLNYLCVDFFHNNGNGPPLRQLKNEQYQALLLLPVYYDHDVDYLKAEVDRLSPAFVKALRDRNSFETSDQSKKSAGTISRASTIVRNKTISANATAKARAKAEEAAQQAMSDPISAQTDAEDIILRILIIKDEKSFVARRLEQREKLAHSIATERLARAAAEGMFQRR